MTSISAQASGKASFNVGGAGISAGASASVQAHFQGSPLGAVGTLASAAVSLGASLGERMGGTLLGALAAAGGVAQGAVGFLTANPQLLAAGVDRYLGGIDMQVAAEHKWATKLMGKEMADAFKPPSPRDHLKASGRLTVEGRAHHAAEMEARFKVKNGGFSSTADVSFKNNRDFGSFSVSGKGHVSAETRADIKTSMDAAVHFKAGGGSARSQLGFDLAAKCAGTPHLSAVAGKASFCMAGGMGVFGALMTARAEAGGGFGHLKAAFEARFNLGITFGEQVGNRGEVKLPPKPDETKGTEGPKEPEKTGGADLNDPSSFLNDPSLSFESKLMLFMLSVCKRQEDRITGMMRTWEAKQSAATKKKDGGGGAEGKDKAAGGGGNPLGGLMGGGGGGGGGSPIAGMLGGGGGVGGVMDLVKGFGPQILNLAASTAPMWMPMLCSALGTVVPGAGNLAGGVAGMAASGVASGVLSGMAGALEGGALDQVAGGITGGGGAGGAKGGGGAKGAGGAEGKAPKAQLDNAAMEEGAAKVGDKDSEQTFMQKLQVEQQTMTKMYELMSTMMKSFHDTQMGSIRNMK